MAKDGTRSQPLIRRSDVVSRIDDACRQAVAGKLAVRQLARWAEGFGLGETDFRLLWTLFADGDCGAAAPDQAELAARLAVSAAQVSGGVERLRVRQLIEPGASPGDRRRQVWRLAGPGRLLVAEIIAAIEAAPRAGASAGEAA